MIQYNHLFVNYLLGDARDICRELPAKSVQMVVTSPPYWAMRDYGVKPTVWGGDPSCKHIWGPQLTRKKGGKTQSPYLAGKNLEGHHSAQTLKQGQFCTRCNAWFGCLGLEPTPELYVEHVVEVFREVKRVLRDDGSLWLNLGDSYASGSMTPHCGQRRDGDQTAMAGIQRRASSLSRKDLVGIPWRVAFALQDDGWILRCDMIWEKKNPMPDSTKDRPTRSHDYIFLLSKKEHYFYDQDAVREPQSPHTLKAFKNGIRPLNPKARKHPAAIKPGLTKQAMNTSRWMAKVPGGRNRRSVWTFSTQPCKYSHFASFPDRLVEICVLAGSSPKACPKCGAPWKKRFKIPIPPPEVYTNTKNPLDGFVSGSRKEGKYRGFGKKYQEWRDAHPPVFVGWDKTCKCEDNDGSGFCVVLDPFVGTGTTIKVSRSLGRSVIGIDLKPEYKDIAKKKALLSIPDIQSF